MNLDCLCHFLPVWSWTHTYKIIAPPQITVMKSQQIRHVVLAQWAQSKRPINVNYQYYCTVVKKANKM